MIPILYSPTDAAFETFGIGALPDAISPHVVEERNGEYTFEMQYPVDGTNYENIELRSIIKALPSPGKDPQPFRIYRITKPINGIVTIYARHIRYDLEGVPVSPFSANSLADALTAIKSHMMVENSFVFITDKTSSIGMTSVTPASTLSLMGGTEGSLLDIYGGEYDYDKYNIYLKASRGESTDVVIRYGVNLVDLEQEENCSNVYTGVLAFWKSGQDDTTVTGTIQSAGTFDFTRVKVLDRSANYDHPPTQAQLNNDAVAYINEAKVGVPRVSINVQFFDLSQIEEYSAGAYTLKLCDLVTIEFEKLGVSAKAKIIRTDFDVINERYISLDIGDSRTTLSDTIIGISTKAEMAPTVSEMQQAINATTAAITGANGGAVRLLDTNDDDLPDTLYIADNPEPLLASKVWRFNYEGWGASQNGYAGPFTMGATFQQGFIADFITAGTLSADRIGANTIAVSKLTGKIQNSGWEINLTNGTLTIGTISANSITSGTIDASRITVTNLNADNITTGSINGQRITDLTITGGKIASETITGTKLSNSTITGSKLQNLTITGSKIAEATLPGDKLENHTLNDLQMESHGLSTFSTSGGINTSLQRADFSHDVFNNTATANYCHAKNVTVDSVLSAEDRAFANRLFVAYGASYYEASWQQISVPSFTNKYLQVFDGNDNYIGYVERHLVATSSSNVWVLAH